MQEYTFKSNGYREVTVKANNEEEARKKAMQAMYGDCPVAWGKWHGKGLFLQSQ